MTRTSTLINEDNLLSEQLQAAVNYERVNLRIDDLQRAERYLRAAGEAARRFANTIKMVQQYDYSEMRAQPWTLVNTKEQLMQHALKNSNRYKAFIDWHHQILLKLLTK